MDWQSLLILAVSGVLAAGFLRAVLRRANSLLFWESDKQKLERQIRQIHGVLGDQDRRIDQLEEELRRMPTPNRPHSPPA